LSGDHFHFADPRGYEFRVRVVSGFLVKVNANVQCGISDTCPISIRKVPAALAWGVELRLG